MRKETLARPAHSQVRVNSGFWGEQIKKIHGNTVWDVIEKFENDSTEGVMRNYELVAQGEKGRHIGPPWYDGLICEVIRGISDIIAHSYDARLDEKLDQYARAIQAAQAVDPDGYINTYGTLVCPDRRWGENGGSILWQHETYNIGCLVEAGIHHFLATGKTLLLSLGVRAANCMCAVMGPKPRKNIVPAHSLAEEAMVKMYRLLTDRPEVVEALNARHDVTATPQAYLDLSVFWLDHRGVHEERASFPHYMGEYAQDHRPVVEQAEAVGHAVRAGLMYTGLVATGIETSSQPYLDAALRLWNNVTQTKMHISGGIGAVHNEERFGYQYDLPNNAYLETCAGVALCFWAGEMHRAFGDSGYMDVFERALYNNVLPGLSADGKRYFYENPLMSDGSIERWAWHRCPCCPPMFLKLMGSLPDYIYSVGGEGIHVNLHIGSRATLSVRGQNVEIEQADCSVPWEGSTHIAVRPEAPLEFVVGVRVPEWSGEYSLCVNGKAADYTMRRGYAHIKQEWRDGDVIELTMQMPALRVEAHPYVEADAGRVALVRGPLLYCVEAVDNVNLAELTLGGEQLCVEPFDLFGPVKALIARTVEGERVVAVPYFLWNNRGKGTMDVWLKQQGKKAETFSTRFSQTGVYTARVPSYTGNERALDGWEGRLYREFQP